MTGGVSHVRILTDLVWRSAVRVGSGRDVVENGVRIAHVDERSTDSDDDLCSKNLE